MEASFCFSFLLSVAGDTQTRRNSPGLYITYYGLTKASAFKIAEKNKKLKLFATSNSKFGSRKTSKFRICFIFLAKICVTKRLEVFLPLQSGLTAFAV